MVAARTQRIDALHAAGDDPGAGSWQTSRLVDIGHIGVRGHLNAKHPTTTQSCLRWFADADVERSSTFSK